MDDAVQLLLDSHSSLLPQSLLQYHSNSLAATTSSDSSSGTDGDSIAQMLLEKAKASTLSCDLFETRLDLYAEAAERGSAEALHLWAMMIRYGYESSASGASCGYEKATAANAEKEGDQERALLAFLIAADMGFAPALVPIALSVLTGLGVDVLLHTNGRMSVSQFAVPVSREYLTVSRGKAASGSVASLLDGTSRKDPEGDRVYRVTPLHQQLSEYLTEAVVLCQWRQDNGMADDNGDRGGKTLISLFGSFIK